MKFQVFKDGKLTSDFSLCGAYMFGADKVPLRTLEKMSFEKGVIDCEKKTSDAAGLSLLWPIPDFGNILLSTTRLEDRVNPYILNLELARAALMEITIKREDWSLFEEDNSFADLAHDAQALFIQALQNLSDASKASLLADESLKKARFFAEKLAAKHADFLFDLRRKNQSLGRHSIGCQIDPSRIGDRDYVTKLTGRFSFVSIPINWGQIESKKGEYDFSAIDKCIDVLTSKKLMISVGPLLCFSPDYLPKWLLKNGSDFEKVREVSYEFVSKIVTRYSKYIHAWRVIAGMNAVNHFGFNFEQILEMTRTAVLAAKDTVSRALKMVEIVFPWGEYYASMLNSIPPLIYLDMITQSGISVDAFSLQMQFGKNQPGMHVRDMMQISAMLDRFAPVAKPFHITSVAVPDKPGTGEQSCETAGMWHKAWDRTLQAEWTERFCRVALSKPYINTITFANLADGPNDKIKGSGLMTEQLEPKESLKTLAKLQKLTQTG